MKPRFVSITYRPGNTIQSDLLIALDEDGNLYSSTLEPGSDERWLILESRESRKFKDYKGKTVTIFDELEDEIA